MKRRYVTLLLTCILLAAAQPISTAQVKSITIDSTFGGLGPPPSPGHIVIERRGNAFVRNDGTVIASADVDTLIALLQPPYGDTVRASDAGLAGDALRATLPAAERCLNDTVQVPAVRAAFENAYLDQKAQDDWLARWFDPRHLWTVSDFYPRVKVTVDTNVGSIEATSSSQAPLMLPFLVASPPGGGTSYDARLPLAIAALMPLKATNRSILTTDWIVEQRAIDICGSKDVKEAQTAFGRGAFDDDARRAGLSVLTYQPDGMGNWSGTFVLADNPRVQTELLYVKQTTGTAFATMQDAVRRAHALLAVPWVAQALVRQPTGHVMVSYGNTIGETMFSEIESTGHMDAYRYLKDNNGKLIFIRMFSDTPNRLSKPWWPHFSSWVLFPDGTMMLEAYAVGMSGFPLGKQSYDQFPHQLGYAGMMNVVGILVRPDGTWEVKSP